MIICQSTVSFASFNKVLQKRGPAEYAIIYGRIDCTPANAYLTEVMFVRPAKYVWGGKNDAKDNWLNGDKGYFWAIVKPGQYYLYSFGSVKRNWDPFSRNGGQFINIMPDQDKPDDIKSKLITVNEGDMFYWGSAKYIRTRKSGVFKSSEHAIEPVTTSEAREVLEFLLKDAKGTKWEPVIKKKMELIP